MAPIDKSYHLLLVCHCNFAPLSSYLTLNNIVNLKSRLGVTQDHWKWNYSIDRIGLRVPIRLPL